MRSAAVAATAVGSVVAVGLALGSTTVAAAAAPSALDTAPATQATSHLVVLDDSAAARTVAAAHADRFGFDLRHVYTTAIRGYAAPMSATTAAAIQALPGVAWVQEDAAVSTSAQTTPTGIDRAEADLSPTAAIDGVDERVDVDVAVIDTGVDLSHPDLNVYRGGVRNCSIGAISANDLNGHGTHVAGTIRALDNASGAVGVAPGARIWPVKVLTTPAAG